MILLYTFTCTGYAQTLKISTEEGKLITTGTGSSAFCFSRESYSGEQGTAPGLWNYSFGSVTSTGCFGGSGNSATSISNYAGIPTGWY